MSTGRFAVVGNPVAHSLSPDIHQAFALQTGVALSYEKLLAPVEEFAAAVDAFRADGGCGVNVTVPFKGDAFRYADTSEAAAARAGAVNTLKFSADRVLGFNTDGVGLLRDITRRHGVELQGHRVLMLGAGGAARGVLAPLLAAGPGTLVIANRTPAKAAELADLFRQEAASAGVELAGQGLPVAEPFDVIVNATALGLADDGIVPLTPAAVAGAFCYDMSYGSNARFCHWSRAAGAATSVDGLGMLVEQAAESFRIWHDVAPATQPVVDTLRRQLDNP